MDKINILKTVQSEMKPSVGCTEPVAIGLAVSNTCRYLSKPATKLKLKLSSNIFKNAFCVKIPNTKNSGIPLAATLGYLLTKQDNTMEIFNGVNDDLVQKAYDLIKLNFIEIEAMSSMQFYIEVWAENQDEKVHTLTLDKHDNLIFVQKNEDIIIDNTKSKDVLTKEDDFDITKYSIKELVDFAQNIELDSIEFLSDAIQMNLAASNEGLINDYGIRVGKSIQNMINEKIIPEDLFYHVRMVVSSASDMRMGGGKLSVMTVLGSGNQGFQTTLPIVAACQYLKKDNETILRALFMSILITIRQKYKVGRLSPICGATLAGASCAAVFCWILGGTIEQMEGAMRNMYANLIGMMCDGAKDGCAIKLSTCSGEAVLAARLALCGSMASGTDGIVSHSVEDCIDNIAKLSQQGMQAVDMNVIDIILEKNIIKL